MANTPDMSDEQLVAAVHEMHLQGRKLTRTALREYVADRQGAGVTSSRAGQALRTAKRQIAEAEQGVHWVPDDEHLDDLPEGVLPAIRRLPTIILQGFHAERRGWAERQDEMHRALQDAHARQLGIRDAKVAATQHDLEQAREQLDDLEAARQALQAQLDERDKRIECLEAQVDQERTEAAAQLTEERQKRDSSQTEAQRAVEAMHAAKTALAGAVAERDGAKGEIQPLREQIKDLRGEAREYRAEAKTARDQADALRDELAECQRTSARLEAAVGAVGQGGKQAKGSE